MMHVLYLSTNHSYGGSEKLWITSAKEFSKSNKVSAYVHYEHDFIADLHANYGVKVFRSTAKDSKWKGWFRSKFSGTLDLKLILIREKPDLVIINEGGVFSSFREMTLCRHLNIPYVVLNGLVTNFHWLEVTDIFYERFIYLYENAKRLIFVSEQNKQLFFDILTPMHNALVVKNPVSFNYLITTSFPADAIYNIAFVGRFEFYHKGLDILLAALLDSKWKTRNVRFNFYGDGPHKEILKFKIQSNQLSHCFVYDSNYDFTSIWAVNHIAIHTSRFEGKSLSITEAMYNKRPIIMTNVGGVSELIVDGVNGFVSRDISVEQVSNTLERAWHQRASWEEMGIKSREVYDRLNENLTLNQLILS